MSNKGKRKKRSIVPPLRSWPPITSTGKSSPNKRGDKLGPLTNEIGLAGADDLVQWLAVLMNEKGTSYGELARLSGIPARTTKKWFSANEKTRTTPNLRTIQACFEALGQSLIACGPAVPIGHDQHFFPIDNFRRTLLEKWLVQSAKFRGISGSDFIDLLEDNHKQAISRGTKSYRRRVL